MTFWFHVYCKRVYYNIESILTPSVDPSSLRATFAEAQKPLVFSSISSIVYAGKYQGKGMLKILEKYSIRNANYL